MHHIALCTTCITLFNYDHPLHIRVDHVESKTVIQAKKIQCVLRGPQASSCEDDYIVVIKTSPGASNHHP
jgi:hypothetical protein